MTVIQCDSLTGMCCKSVDRSLCSFIGWKLLPNFLTLICRNSGLLKKIVHANVALGAS